MRFSSGRVLGAAEGGPCNLHIDLDSGLDTLRETIEACLEQSGYLDADRRQIALGLGVAGIGMKTSASDPLHQQITNLFDDFGRVCLVSDGVTAALGAHHGGDGGIVIAGTGSCACLYRAGTAQLIGGRGFLLGDDGSAAVLGRTALRDALRAADGFIEESALTEAVLSKFAFEGDGAKAPEAIVRFAKNAISRDYGAFAPLVFEYACQNDAHALQLVRHSAHGIEELIVRLADLSAPRICLVGGMSEAIAPYLDADIAELLQPCLFDAQDGAILLCGGSVTGSY